MHNLKLDCDETAQYKRMGGGGQTPPVECIIIINLLVQMLFILLLLLFSICFILWVQVQSTEILL